MKHYKTGEFAKLISVSNMTLNRWDKEGKLVAYRTPTNRRFYTEEQLQTYLGNTKEEPKRKNVGYARVSTINQKSQLQNQKNFIEMYSLAQGYIIDEIVEDIGSGLNYNRPNWNKLLKEVENNQINKIFITYKDRFIRFGFKWFENFCNNYNTEIIVLNQSTTSPEQELAEDLMSIVTVFSARHHGIRKYKNKLQELSNENS